MVFFPATWLLPRPDKSIKSVTLPFSLCMLQFTLYSHGNNSLLLIRLIIKTLHPQQTPKLLHLHRLSPSVPFLQVVLEGLFHLDPP